MQKLCLLKFRNNTDCVLLRLFVQIIIGTRVNRVQEKRTIFILYRQYTINYWTILQMTQQKACKLTKANRSFAF